MNPAAVGFVAFIALLLCALLGSLTAQGWWLLRDLDPRQSRKRGEQTLAYGAVLVAAFVVMLFMWETKP